MSAAPRGDRPTRRIAVHPSLKTRLTSCLLTRGESAVAALGLGGAIVMMAAIAAGGWWTLRTNQISKSQGRERELQIAAELLAENARAALEAGELSGLRTLVAATAACHDIEHLAVVLGDPAAPGTERTVLAEANPKPGTRYAPLPDAWPAGPNPDEPPTLSRAGDTVQIDVPVAVRNKGVATLTLRDSRPFPLLGEWEVVAGIGAIGVCGMAAVLAGYRVTRRRFRALGAVNDALAALSAGERETAALSVCPDFGPEAREWNRLIGEVSTLRARLAIDRAAAAGGNRRQGGDLTSLCDGLWQGLVLVDEQLRIRYANGAAAIFLRAKRDDVQGKELPTLVADEKAIQAVRSVATGQTRSRTVVEVEIGDPENGRTVLRFSVRPVRKEDSATAILVIEDVTQQRIADESRQAFVATATHELRTPLTNVRLYVDTLLEDPQQDVRTRSEAMNVISTEVRRLERMVGDMLSVAQIEAGQIKLQRGDIALEPIFEELRHDFARQAGEKDITLKFDLPPKWPQIDGDRDKVVMALHNLVGNAVKYTPA
ncbi:MAG: PAS domain-containing protein, partial [Phycisphaerales bacterium]|nr:PAS domain-containing protein [Phycisphaerales bacterium]